MISVEGVLIASCKLLRLGLDSLFIDAREFLNSKQPRLVLKRMFKRLEVPTFIKLAQRYISGSDKPTYRLSRIMTQECAHRYHAPAPDD